MLKQEKIFGFLTLSPRLRTHNCYELSFLDSVTALRLGSLGQQCGTPQLHHEFTGQPSPAVLIILVFAACLAEECMQPRCWWILCRSPLLVSSIKLSLSNFPRKTRGKKVSALLKLDIWLYRCSWAAGSKLQEIRDNPWKRTRGDWPCSHAANTLSGHSSSLDKNYLCCGYV